MEEQALVVGSLLAARWWSAPTEFLAATAPARPGPAVVALRLASLSWECHDSPPDRPLTRFRPPRSPKPTRRRLPSLPAREPSVHSGQPSSGNRSTRLRESSQNEPHERRSRRWGGRGSNPGPADYESAPAILHASMNVYGCRWQGCVDGCGHCWTDGYCNPNGNRRKDPRHWIGRAYKCLAVLLRLRAGGWRLLVTALCTAVLNLPESKLTTRLAGVSMMAW